MLSALRCGKSSPVATTFSLRAPSGETRFQFISQSQGIKQGEKTLIPDGPVNIYRIWVAMHGSSVKRARTTTQVKIGGQAPKRFARVSNDANLAWLDSFTVQEVECARKMITERAWCLVRRAWYKGASTTPLLLSSICDGNRVEIRLRMVKGPMQ